MRQAWSTKCTEFHWGCVCMWCLCACLKKKMVVVLDSFLFVLCIQLPEENGRECVTQKSQPPPTHSHRDRAHMHSCLDTFLCTLTNSLLVSQSLTHTHTTTHKTEFPMSHTHTQNPHTHTHTYTHTHTTLTHKTRVVMSCFNGVGRETEAYPHRT